MCHSPAGCISPACPGAAPARGRASGRSEVQFLGHSFQSTGKACTTRPLQGGWFGKLLLAPADGQSENRIIRERISCVTSLFDNRSHVSALAFAYSCFQKSLGILRYLLNKSVQRSAKQPSCLSTASLHTEPAAPQWHLPSFPSPQLLNNSSKQKNCMSKRSISPFYQEPSCVHALAHLEEAKNLPWPWCALTPQPPPFLLLSAMSKPQLK